MTTHTSHEDGTRTYGLRLSITKAIVDALGGRIWVEGTVGVGSTVSFALPSSRHAVAALARRESDVPRA